MNAHAWKTKLVYDFVFAVFPFLSLRNLAWLHFFCIPKSALIFIGHCKFVRVNYKLVSGESIKKDICKIKENTDTVSNNNNKYLYMNYICFIIPNEQIVQIKQKRRNGKYEGRVVN